MKICNVVCLGMLLAACGGSNAEAVSPVPPPAPTDAPEAAPTPMDATQSEPPKAPEPAFVAPVTPDEIKAPSGAQPVVKLSAKGVQIYECGPKKDAPKEFEWSLKAPEASLMDSEGKDSGKHFAGPTWQAADGSKVMGALKTKVDAPVAEAIPWLLLEATGHEGEGAFAAVGFIQRVDTVGGKAPAKGCDKKHAKAEVKVDYSASYYFYTSAK